MLRLSDVFKSKELWLVEYGYMGFDDNDAWYFGGPDDEWSVWVPDKTEEVWVQIWIVLKKT